MESPTGGTKIRKDAITISQIDANLHPAPVHMCVRDVEDPTREASAPAAMQMGAPRQLHLATFRHHLSNHPDQAFAKRVINTLEFGARIGYTGPRCARIRKNWPSTKLCPDKVRTIIRDDVIKGRKVGPFSTPPFKNFVGSPLGAIPRKLSDKIRLIHDLSFPPGVSVNDGIPHEFATVQYMALDDAIKEIVTSGPGTLLAKLDLKDAYKHIVVHPDDWDLLGLTLDHNGKTEYYVDVTLPFGLASAPKIFTDVADAFAFIMYQEGITYVDHYVDDFITIGPPGSPICANNLKIIIDCCHQVNFEISTSPGKVCNPATIMEFLGFILDTEKLEIRISEKRKQEVLEELASFLDRPSFTKRNLLSLIGKLTFASKVVRAGRTFVRSLIQLSCSTRHLHHHLHLSKAARQDIEWWQLFLPRWNGVSLMPSPLIVTNMDLQLYTDASLTGLGAVCGSTWWAIPMSTRPGLEQYTIAYLELFAVVTAIATFTSLLQGQTVLLHCDNQVIVAAVSSGTCRCPHVMSLIRALFYYCAQASILIKCQYINTKINSAADALSRLDFSRFRTECPKADAEPTPPVDIRELVLMC
jgi:hypothetical protein